MGRLSDPEGDRVSVPLTAVPDHVQKALLAAEDRQFYTQGGISPTGIARAVWSGPVSYTHLTLPTNREV